MYSDRNVHDIRSKAPFVATAAIIIESRSGEERMSGMKYGEVSFIFFC
jgi:hypothetical protein